MPTRADIVGLQRSSVLLCQNQLASQSRNSIDLADDIFLDCIELHSCLASRSTTHRNSGLVDRFGRTGHERVPPSEPTSFRQPSVGTGFWQPANLAQLIRRNHNTIRYTRVSISVVAASAGPHVEKVASDLGEIDLTRVLCLDLQQAALPATIAERLPLASRHGLQALRYPKRYGIWRRSLLPIIRIVGIAHRICKFTLALVARPHASLSRYRRQCRAQLGLPGKGWRFEERGSAEEVRKCDGQSSRVSPSWTIVAVRR